MKTNHITLRPDRLDLPLAPCAWGRRSSAVVTIGGDIPDDIESLALDIEYTDASATTPVVRRYTAAATRQDGGEWRAYLAPAYFPAATDALSYHVLGADSHGHARWLGTGRMRIFDNPADGSPVMPDVLPRDTYVYSPTDHRYHQVIVDFDEGGFPMLSVDRQGVEL